MSDERMGDDVYQPDNEEQADAAALDLEDALDERTYDDLLDEGYSPPEKPLGAQKKGVTAAGQREGESLDERLAQEEPDVGAALYADQDQGGDGGEADRIGDLAGGDGEPLDPQAGERRAGRLVGPDQGAHPREDNGAIASDVGIDGAAAGAEEAAMHVIPDDADRIEDR